VTYGIVTARRTKSNKTATNINSCCRENATGLIISKITDRVKLLTRTSYYSPKLGHYKFWKFGCWMQCLHNPVAGHTVLYHTRELS